MVAPCVALAERLDATLVNMRFVKPLDSDLVCRLASTHSCVVTLEENVVAGGAGSAVTRMPGGARDRCTRAPHRHPGPVHRTRLAR
jgi:deoxyxylulose-5-phosphate synthase